MCGKMKRAIFCRLIQSSGFRQGNAGLTHVFAVAVFVGSFADFVALEEEDLRHAFAGVDFGGQGGGVGKLEGNVAFPFRLERGDVDDDAAAGVGGFAQADGQDVARDAEVFDRARQREGIGRDDAAVVFDGDEVFRVEVFGIDDGAVDVGEDFEFVGAADVVAVAGRAVGDDALSVGFFDLVRLEGVDHAEFFAHAAYPFVGLDAHNFFLVSCGFQTTSAGRSSENAGRGYLVLGRFTSLMMPFSHFMMKTGSPFCEAVNLPCARPFLNVPDSTMLRNLVLLELNGSMKVSRLTETV